MKSLATVFVLLTLSASAPGQPYDRNRPPLGHGDLKSYPWSEATEWVRVPKGLLRYFDFAALDVSKDPGHPNWIVSDSFIGLFGLTAAQTEALSLLVHQARDAQRQAEGNHLKPVDGPLPMGSYRPPAGLTVLEERTFLLEPYPSALDEIEGNLRAGLLQLLGKQRSEEFWRRSNFQRTILRSTAVSESLTFRLIEIRETRSVDLLRVSGGSSSSGPYSEEADRFAPESLRPLLKKWRDSVHDFQRTNSASVAETPVPGLAKDAGRPTIGNPDANRQSPPSPIPPHGNPLNVVWDEGTEYVDFSKSRIPGLGIPTIDDDDKLSPEAEVLFGFTSDEAEAVSGLFKEFRVRFEQLEASHFTRQNPVETRYVLSKFPDEANSLHDEWLRRLKEVSGNRRGELLDQCMKDTGTQFRRRRFDNPRVGARRMMNWPVWLLRGNRAFEFSVLIQEGPNAKFSLLLRELDVPNGLNASIGGSLRSFPPELRHYFRPFFRLEGMEPPQRPGPNPF
ncbi:MAG: hypothetical protein AB7O66_10485 [Limisphaerales bacterium]